MYIHTKQVPVKQQIQGAHTDPVSIFNKGEPLITTQKVRINLYSFRDGHLLASKCISNFHDYSIIIFTFLPMTILL